MKILQRGHRYELNHRGGTNKTTIQYTNREPGQECEGVVQQELLRMMIDRNRYCTACLPNSVSRRIQYHLQMALILHEMRALERKVQKGELLPEYVEVGEDGHFALENIKNFGGLDTMALRDYKEEWESECNHHSDQPLKNEYRWYFIFNEKTKDYIGQVLAENKDHATRLAKIDYDYAIKDINFVIKKKED